MIGTLPAGPGAATPLVGMCVLDLADASGAQCGRILADLGADVLKVEPPAGDPARRLGPFVDGRPGPERSLLWASLNANKRGITLDIERPSARELFRRLVERADVVIESFPPGYLDERGLGEEVLLGWNADIVVTSIAPYGGDGPLAQAPASDLEVTAASGALWLAGEPGRPPVRTSLAQSHLWSGMYAALGTLVAYLAVAELGGGQHVDASAQASMATVHAPAGLFFDLLGEEHGRLGPYLLGRSVVGSRFRNIWPCRDGYVSFAVQGGAIGRHTGRMLAEWMASRGDVPEVLRAIDWETFDNTTLRQDEVERIEAAIAPFFASLSRREFFEGVLERNMLGYPVATVEDIAADEQLAARDFWTSIELGERGEVRFPGGFALFDGERPAIRRAAPRLGEHNAEVYAELGIGPEQLADLRGAGIV